MYQGDPALKIHAPIAPDVYYTEWEQCLLTSVPSTTLLSTFDLVNLGKTSTDSIEMVLTASNSSETKEVFRGMFDIPNYKAKRSVTIEKSNFLSGLITFGFNIDPSNKIQENMPIGETNNLVSFDHLFELKKPLIIYPLPNAIVNTSDVEFVFPISKLR